MYCRRCRRGRAGRVCCSVLQCVAELSALQCTVVYGSNCYVMHYNAVDCNVLQMPAGG